MKLMLKDEKKYPSGNVTKIYDFEVSSVDDIVNVMQDIEQEYGIIEDIYCLKYDDKGRVEFLEDYDTLEDFKRLFTEDEIKHYEFINFKCKDKYISFTMDRDKNILSVYNNEVSQGKKVYDPSNVEYYQDSYGNIVKYDKNREMLFSFDKEKNMWIKRRDLIGSFFDYDSDYTLIDYDESGKLKR